MRVETTQPDLVTSGLGRLAATPAGGATPTSFAATLAATTVGTVSGSAGTGSTAAATTTAVQAKDDAQVRTAAKAPKGETTRKVEGKPYLEVMSGPRNGMFINHSGNARDGEAFVLVRRKDHDLHVYGTGKDRRVVVVPHEDGGGIPSGGPKKETTGKVDGHDDYVEIVSGPRNGMFINRSGNARDGEAFVLVERKDHELHIYGTGKDRQVIVARYGDETESPAAGDATEATPATGGAAAPAA